MGQIRVLPDHLANQIAAGEVVERPASALKELMENAFDAGAKSIRVTLENGGKKRIRVTDDGSGMDRDDCLMALERHATSKLDRAEDLFSIKTLGFRGEALPSIASVSHFTLESRTREAEAGVRIETHGSKITKVTEISRNPGTTVTVDNLFFNIPARKKFLRKVETELSWMVNLVTQYSVNHVTKHFFLEHNGRTLIDVSPVKTLKERLFQHFGRRMLDELADVSATKDWLSIRGAVSTPNLLKTSRVYQYLFVNGRLVKDRVLNHAIDEAYRGFGEGRIYPVAFLFIDLPSAEIDVNVHPAKTEVKFINRNFVHDAVRDAIRETLVERKVTVPYRFREAYHPHPSHVPDKRENPRRDPWQKTEPQPQAALPGQDPVTNSPLFDQAQNTHEHTKNSKYDQFLERNRDLIHSREPGGMGWVDPKIAEQHDQPKPVQTGITEKPSAANVAQTSDTPDPQLFENDTKLTLPKIIGQFRDSYIIAEQEGDLLLIDQHVAHERILYDQIVEGLENNSIERQALLTPETVELTPQQAVELEDLLPEVRKFGFDLEPYGGGAFVVREIPMFAKGKDIAKLVSELVEKAQGARKETALEAMIDHFAADKACKAAVKINMHLTPEKMEHLIEVLWASSSPLFCPHGRPIILRFRNDEIEKNFLRK